MSIPSSLETALKYAAYGWSVLPLRARRKEPATSHGLHDATRDERAIREWWGNGSAYNVGVATGEGSGIVVIDLDGPEGRESWAALEQEHGAVQTLSQQTGRADGGTQLVFRHPGVAVGNRAAVRPGIDVRGDGGYIVVPPSIHPTGAIYEWVDRSPIAVMPEWLVELTRKKVVQRSAAASVPRKHSTPGNASAYGLAGLRSECDSVEQASEGGRNHELNRAAFSVGQLVGGGELGREQAEDDLFDAAIAAGLGETESRKTIKSGLDSGERDPRSAPPRADGWVEGSPPDFSCIPPPDDADAPAGGVGDGAPTEYLRTDIGNSEAFVTWHGDDLRYCYARSSWFAWDGRRWRIDAQSDVERMAASSAKRMLKDAVSSAEDDSKSARIKHALKSQSVAQRDAMTKGARHLLAVCDEQMDADPWLINVQNGTVDLRTGKPREHRRSDLNTRVANSEFNAEAECPAWLAFLDRIMDRDEELVSFLQRAAGYSLTAHTGEQAFVLLIGPTGANGKSTFLSTLSELLGDYSMVVGFKTLLSDDKSRNKDPELAELNGPRFVTAAEPDPGSRFDEGLIKRLTGCEEVTAARKYEHPITFRPVLKLWLGCNSPPRMRRGGEAIKRRLLCVPFDVQIPEGERDHGLERKLRAEGPGILAWAVRGGLWWQEDGLRPPKKVTATRDDYLDEQDPIAEWMEERTERGLKVLLRLAYADYVSWAGRRGCSPVRDRAFAEMLRERGFSIRKSHGKRWVEKLELGATDHDSDEIGGSAGAYGSPGQRGLYD